VVAATTISSRLIGRDAELSALLEAVGEAGAGRPALAFVAGESGVGKSRLLTEVMRRARDEGARVLSGECVELGDGELPYAPLVGALRPLVRAGDPALLELPDAARVELAALLPDLGNGTVAGPPQTESDRRSQSQARLFEALLAALDRLGRDAPVVLIVEDVHWADRSTRDFLSFLGRNLAEERVLVALSYRPDELHRRHPLRPLLAVLERTPRARRIELRGLLPGDVRTMAHEVLGSEPSAELVDRLVRRSDGNALFIEELLAAGPGPLPPSLADALMVRVERLPAPAQEVVRVLSVAQPADHALLEALDVLDDAALRTALRDAIAGHVVAVDGSDRYTFRHVLLREVVYDDLLPGERSELHRAVARALEARLPGDGGPGLAAAVAHHFHRSGDQPEALRTAILAADAATAAHAEADAAQLLERALELWERVAEPEALVDADRFDHVDLLLAASRAHRNSDDQRRVTLLNEALREARGADPDDRRVPTLLQQRAMAEWGLGRGEASRASLDLARRLLPDDAPATQRIALTVSRMKLATLQSRYAETIALAEEVLPELPGGDEGHALRSETYNNFGLALIMTDRHEEGVAALRESAGLARAVEDYVLLGIAYVNLGDALHLSGLPDEARAVTEEALTAGGPGVPGFAWVPTLAAELAIDRGDWEAADEYLRGVGRTSGNTRVNVELRRAELALGRGQDDLTQASLEEVEALLVDSLEPQFVAVAGVLRAELDRRRGRLTDARDAVDNALERLEFCSDDTVRLARLAATGVAIEADLAQRARDLGDADGEADAIARAGVMRSRAEAAAAAGRPMEVAYATLADGHHRRATGEDPGEAWETAAVRWEELKRPLLVATARRHAAEACLARGRRDTAADAAGIALAGARELGAVWLVDELEGLVARARLTLDAERPAPSPAAETAPEDDLDPFGLTPRERQVLSLVARGATNREIGAELYMAEKTASVHVSRILAKLDVRSRTEAAAVAHRLGLAEA
jgi:DNA-binding CsgD family transcriptional regulator